MSWESKSSICTQCISTCSDRQRTRAVPPGPAWPCCQRQAVHCLKQSSGRPGPGCRLRTCGPWNLPQSGLFQTPDYSQWCLPPGHTGQLLIWDHCTSIQTCSAGIVTSTLSLTRYPVMLPVPYWMDRGVPPHLYVDDWEGLNFLWFSAQGNKYVCTWTSK